MAGVDALMVISSWTESYRTGDTTEGQSIRGFRPTSAVMLGYRELKAIFAVNGPRLGADHEQPFPNPVMEGWSTIGSESIHTEGRTRLDDQIECPTMNKTLND